MKVLKKCRKYLVCIIAVFISTVSVGAASYTLVWPELYYHSQSWTWSYSAGATNSYNCLGYATGSMTWEWPWGDNNPTDAQVTTYLKSKGYKTSGSNPYIISYGKASNITHFSKVTGTSWCRAKWGPLERMNHGSYDPYNLGSTYGKKFRIYYK